MHDLVFKDGEAMMVYRDRDERSLPWHGYGTGISEPIRIEQLYSLCDMGREISLEPITYLDNASGDIRTIPNRFAVVDSSGRCLGVVSERYQVLQDYQLLTSLRPLCEEHSFTIETAGLLKGGAQTWVQLERDLKADVRPSDQVRGYVLATNAHDGTRHVELGEARTRVVCANTLAVARKENGLAKLRHTGDIKGKLDQLVAAYEYSFVQDVEVWKAMAGKVVHQTTLDQFFAEFLGPNSKRTEEKITEAFESGFGNTGSTLWDLYNGVTQVVSHNPGRGSDTTGDKAIRAFGSMHWGAGAKSIQKASDIIVGWL